MSDPQHELAVLVHRLRRIAVPNGSEWQVPGIRAQIDKCEGANPCEIASAAFALAAREDMETPALLSKPGPWWNKGPGMTGPKVSHNVPCIDHDGYDMPCPHLDHHGQMTLDEIAEAAAKVRAAIPTRTREPRPTTLTEPADRLEQVRALIPQEDHDA